MKRRLPLALIIAIAVTAIVVSVVRKARTPVGPSAVVKAVADVERGATRLPAMATRMSDEQEIAVGDELARHEPYAADEESAQGKVAAYVTRVGLRVSGHAHRKLPYHFHYVSDSWFVNAFALPGGHVFIGGGLLELMNSEDELAAVLGHEIEHIDHYHCAERAQAEMIQRKLPLGGLAALPVDVFMAGYSKDQELEADREGTRLAVLAGYSPYGAVRMFQAYERLEQQYVDPARSPAENPTQEITKLTVQTLQGYFRSHPPSIERENEIRKLIAQEHWKEKAAEKPLTIWGALHPKGAGKNGV